MVACRCTGSRTQAELAAPVYDGVQAAAALRQVAQVHLRQQRAQLGLGDDIAAGRCTPVQAPLRAPNSWR